MKKCLRRNVDQVLVDEISFCSVNKFYLRSNARSGEG